MRFSLLSDGSSDQALLPILEWSLREVGVTSDLQRKWAELRHLLPPPKGLVDRIRKAVELYPCDLLFVHRDAEAQRPETRRNEIGQAIEELRQSAQVVPHVCVVPVRMQEAWLLISENAIRVAAGNPDGRTPLPLPRVRDLENLPDPKKTLFELIQTGSELTGRRRRKLSLPSARLRIPELIDDFSALRGLSANRAMEEELRQIVEQQHWN